MLGHIKLIRPPLFIMGFIASWALLVKFGLWGTSESLFILLTIGFGNAAFTVWNEICDVEQDKINKPWKPLPSGKVSIYDAKIIARAFMMISVVFLIMLYKYNVLYLCCGLLGYMFGTFYNILKMRGVFGNFSLGATYAIAAFMSTGMSDLIFPVFFAMLSVAHNIMVQLQDYEADKTVKIVTFPQLIKQEYVFISAMILSGTAIIGFYVTYYYLFIVPALLVFLSAYRGKHIESLVRYGARLTLLIAFISMGLEVM